MPQVPVAKLNRRSPEHALYSEAWENLELLAAGGIRFRQAAANFLLRAPKELYDVYAERVRGITYQDILGTILGWYTSQLWKRNPQINIKPDGADSWYKDFLGNCDRAGTSYSDFHRTTFRNLALYGRAWILTDRPKAIETPASRADEQAQGLDKPYVVQYAPQDVLNWATDEVGNLEWVVIKAIENQRRFLEGSGTLIRWYYFDRQEYRVYEWDGTEKAVQGKNQDGFADSQSIQLVDSNGKNIQQESASAELVAQGTHALAGVNRVPIRRIVLPEELWLGNRSYLQLLDHLNQDNSLKWGLFMGNIPMPVVFSDRDPGPMTISQVGYLLFEKDARFEWAAPPTESYALSQKRLDTLREDSYRSFYLQAQGRSSSASASAASGYSKELDMMPANEILNGYGDRIIGVMQDVFADVVVARGGDDQTTSLDVSGFTFTSKPVTESIAAAQELLDLGVFEASPKFEKEAFKRVAADYLEDRNEGLKQEIFDEIDAAPTTAEREQQQKDQAAAEQQKAFSTSFNRMTTRAEAKDEVQAVA